MPSCKQRDHFACATIIWLSTMTRLQPRTSDSLSGLAKETLTLLKLPLTSLPHFFNFASLAHGSLDVFLYLVGIPDVLQSQPKFPMNNIFNMFNPYRPPAQRFPRSLHCQPKLCVRVCGRLSFLFSMKYMNKTISGCESRRITNRTLSH